MKTVIKTSTYEKVMAMKRPKERKPMRPFFALQVLIRILSFFMLLPYKFTYRSEGMEKIGKKEPCLILMNHSSFVDMEIASRVFFPKRYSIITTSDSFVGPLMRWLLPLVGYPHPEICQRYWPGAGYAVYAEGEKDQRADVSGGQLLF